MENLDRQAKIVFRRYFIERLKHRIAMAIVLGVISGALQLMQKYAEGE